MSCAHLRCRHAKRPWLPSATAPSALLLGLAVASCIAGCDPLVIVEGAGGASANPVTTSAETSTSAQSTTSSAQSTTSSNSSGTTLPECQDETEPNDSVITAFALNIDEALPSCPPVAPVTATSALSGPNDVDFFRGQVEKTSACAAPSAFTLVVDDLSLNSKGFEACFYLEDAPAAPLVKACPAFTTLDTSTKGFTGCCAPALPGETTAIELSDLGAVPENVPITFLVRTSQSPSPPACNRYQLSVAPY